jgi:hypothetical protein
MKHFSQFSGFLYRKRKRNFWIPCQLKSKRFHEKKRIELHKIARLGIKRVITYSEFQMTSQMLLVDMFFRHIYGIIIDNLTIL